MLPDFMSIAWFLTIGMIAGWVAGELRRGEGFGLVGNAIIGIGGALLGGLMLNYLQFELPGPDAVGLVVTAFVGSTVLLFLFDRIGIHA